MLWKVRAALPDRPGALAALATACGSAGVNILGMQIFPGVDDVTDEIVLDLPRGWSGSETQRLLHDAGCRFVSASPCSEAALVDQATRYVHAARTVLAEPARFPEVVAALFDAEASAPVDGGLDMMELAVGDVVIQIYRTAPFTATEFARAHAMAGLVNDVFSQAEIGLAGRLANRRLAEGQEPVFATGDDTVSVTVGGIEVARATLGPEGEIAGIRDLSITVDDAFRRRGIGTRLLREAAGLAALLGADEIVITSPASNPAVLPMMRSAGLRGRIRMTGDTLVVRAMVVPFRQRSAPVPVARRAVQLD